MSQETSGTYESDALLKRQAFIDLVTLKRISETSFESSPGGESPGANMYGGTLMSQALMAAGQTSPLQQAHSLHAQLLRPADVLKPTLYEVFTLRESSSFATRRVSARQEDRPVLEAVASFVSPREGIAHQEVSPPAAPPPEELDEQWQVQKLPGRLTTFPHSPDEIRRCPPVWPSRSEGDSPALNTWLRAMAPLPVDILLHAAAIAHLSDAPGAAFISTYHGLPRSAQASLDHALWFHGEPHWEGWHLWHVRSDIAAQSRALIRGELFTREGRLVASMAQEAFYRMGG